MSDTDWATGYAKAVGVLLDGEEISTPDRFGGHVVDDTFYVMLNASELELPWAAVEAAPGAPPGRSVDGAARHPQSREKPGRRCLPTPP